MIGRRQFTRAGIGLAAAVAASGRAALGGGGDPCVGAVLGDASVRRFRSRIGGEVILPSDRGYESARLLYNRRFDSRPVAIVRASSEADVARTIEFARTNGIGLAVRSGGHSYIGASGGSGLVLDLRSMSGVAPLGGPWFRIGAGAQLQRVYGELACGGAGAWTLPSGSCPTVGFGGIAQGGGFGYLQRLHGLTCDRVRAARVVLADGNSVDAGPDGDADLLWALRGGGGGSFGVVTSFDVEAVPYATIRVSGWRWPLALAEEALALFWSVCADPDAPRSVTSALVFDLPSAALAVPQCTVALFASGHEADEAWVRSRLSGTGGIVPVPGSSFGYEAPTPACDPNATPGREHYRAKSSMVSAPPAAGTGVAIREWILARVADPVLGPDDHATVNFLSLGGAVSDLATGDTAFVHRSALMECQFLGYAVGDRADAFEANARWIRGCYAATAPGLAGGGAGCYVNYADGDLTEAEYPGLYWGSNYARLQSVKRRVDPEHAFRGLQTVRP
jgi:FAD/FMN-containing dehydrogenase